MMDLLSSRPFWPLRDGLPATFPPLEGNVTCDVAIIGGGISGAIIAASLVDSGLEVVVLDGREVAHGSTAGNTGLMLYELDVMLHQLAQRVGQLAAQRAYCRCRDAVETLRRLVRRSRVDCGYARKSSLYLSASAAHVPRLRREFAARSAAGLDVAWWSRGDVAANSSLPHAAGILSRDAAQLDTYRFTYGLMGAVQRRGARVHDRTRVTHWKAGRRHVEVFTSRQYRVRARHLVIATGYEAHTLLPKRVGALHSTFALVTEPIAEFVGWPAERALIWDTGDPYLYLRTTSDGRALIGGYDEPFYGPRARDRLLNAKVSSLKRRFRQFFPDIPLEVATAWAGTFGVTADGLPLIGEHPEHRRVWLALGFGGNGTTFSVIAAELIRAGILGRKDPDAELFGLARLNARGRW